MRKIWITVVCCFLLAAVCFGADFTVTRLVTDMNVEHNGRCRVTQTVELDIAEVGEGIVIPVAVNAKKVSVMGPAANIQRKDGKVLAKLRLDEAFTGTTTVTVSYETDGVVTATEQGQQFSAELVSALWEVPTERYSFTVVLPEKTAAQPSFFSGYHADEVEDKLTVVVQDRAISGQLRGGLLDRESFAMQMAVPAGYFSVSGGGSRSSGAAGQWVCGILGYLIVAAAVVYWFMFLRSQSRLRVQARTTPPEGLTPADVPYLLCGGKPDFALLVCHWGSLGYLTVTANSAGRVLLRKSMEMGTERREEERKLFEMLFGSSDVCEAGGSRYLRAMEVAQAVLRQYWTRRLFDRTSGSPMILRTAATLASALAMMNTMMILLPASGFKWLLVLTAFVAGGACGTAVWYGCTRLAVKEWVPVGIGAGAALLMFLMGRFGGGMYLMFPALLVCIFAGIFTRHGGRRTASGSDVVEQTMGFCRFLGHAEDQHLVQMLRQDGQYFYSMMLYAAACGQGQIFARRFGDMELENCAFLNFSEQAPAKASLYYQQFEQLLKLLKG